VTRIVSVFVRFFVRASSSVRMTLDLKPQSKQPLPSVCGRFYTNGETLVEQVLNFSSVLLNVNELSI
jgi:hypothetical protein